MSIMEDLSISFPSTQGSSHIPNIPRVYTAKLFTPGQTLDSETAYHNLIRLTGTVFTTWWTTEIIYHKPHHPRMWTIRHDYFKFFVEGPVKASKIHCIPKCTSCTSSSRHSEAVAGGMKIFKDTNSEVTMIVHFPLLFSGPLVELRYCISRLEQVGNLQSMFIENRITSKHQSEIQLPSRKWAYHACSALHGACRYVSKNTFRRLAKPHSLSLSLSIQWYFSFLNYFTRCVMKD